MTIYAVPMRYDELLDAESLERDLAVEDKLWNGERANKGGFIQEYSGLKPSPFQQKMDVALLERVLNLSAPA